MSRDNPPPRAPAVKTLDEIGTLFASHGQGQEFVVEFEGPAIQAARGLEARSLSTHMLGVANLMAGLRNDVTVHVRRIETIADLFIITYVLVGTEPS